MPVTKYATIPDLHPELWQAAFFIDLVHTFCSPDVLPPPEIAAMAGALERKTRYIQCRYAATPVQDMPRPKRKRRKRPG